MKVIALADQHGLLPEIPECDLLLIGGDVCPDLPITPRDGSGYAAGVRAGAHRQLDWLKNEFSAWLNEIPATDIVAIAGNHDFGLQLPHASRDLQHLRWKYLLDHSVVINGLVIYGTPWVPNLPNWAFYVSPEAAKARAEAIPEGLDILLSHGPPYGHRDALASGDSVGDVALTKRLQELSDPPMAVVCGHIHEGHGIEYITNTAIVNVAFVNERYEAVNGLTDLTDI